MEPATHIVIGSLILTSLFGGAFTQSSAATLLGYSESTIAVQDEQEFCTSNTLEILDFSAVDLDGIKVSYGTAGSQYFINASIKSDCNIADYPIIVALDVRDKDGITSSFAFQNINVSQGDQARVGFSWLADNPGDYDLRIFGHACLNCSGDFGKIQVIHFHVND